MRDPRAGGRVHQEGPLKAGVEMSASSTQPAAPSLEDILWRAMDRFAEEPSVLDAEEFAVRVAAAFGGELPEETFVDRFVDGNPELARKVDMAEAIVRSTPSRLHVYEFDLSHLDYVVIEEEEQVLVVSDFGQFALANDRPAQQAIAAAVVRDRGGLERRAVDRASSEPRGYLVRQDGDLVVLDVQKLAAAIARLPVKQVSVPAVQRPQARLLPFEPRPRRLSQRSEMRALRENDRRASMPVPARSSTSGLEDGFIAGARPTTAAPAVFVLLPDGSLARPEMGSAARWHRMVSDWALRAGLLGSSSSGSVAVSGSRRFAVQAGKVTAVFTGGESRLSPGSVGAAAAARGDGVVAARAGFAPVRVLGDDELAQAVAAGAARIVAGWAAPAAAAGGLSDRYWVQPETVFAPTSEDRELVARADPSAGLDAPAGPQLLAPGEPLQLGQITGDPWTDWALQVGQSGEGAPLAARALRDRAVREIRLRGEPVVAFRAPDGTVLLNGERGPVRLAAADRIREGGSPDGAALGDAAPSGAMEGLRLRATRLAPRSGALPATALAALRTALERTAVAGGYKLPVSELAAAPDAIEVGHALPIGARDPVPQSRRGPRRTGSGGRAHRLPLRSRGARSGKAGSGAVRRPGRGRRHRPGVPAFRRSRGLACARGVSRAPRPGGALLFAGLPGRRRRVALGPAPAAPPGGGGLGRVQPRPRRADAGRHPAVRPGRSLRTAGAGRRAGSGARPGAAAGPGRGRDRHSAAALGTDGARPGQLHRSRDGFPGGADFLRSAAGDLYPGAACGLPSARCGG